MKGKGVLVTLSLSSVGAGVPIGAVGGGGGGEASSRICKLEMLVDGLSVHLVKSNSPLITMLACNETWLSTFGHETEKSLSRTFEQHERTETSARGRPAF